MFFINQTKQRSLLKQRLSALARQVEKRNLDAFLVSSEANRYYLTGWQGDAESGFCLITKKENYYLTDARYSEHVTKATNFIIVESNSGVDLSLERLVNKLKIRSIGFESHDLSVFSNKRFKRHLKGAKLIGVDHMIEMMRSVKNDQEIFYIQNASAIANRAFKHIKKFIKPGMKEIDVTWELEKYMRMQGADGMAWSPFIVAAGKNSSMAHWGVSGAKIKKGDMVQLDYGCSYKGYACDISRVIFVGEPNEEQKKIYNLVFEAQKIGLSLVKEGASGAAIDKKVQGFLKKKTKYYYKHSLGHGVGIDVHELPYVSASRKSKLAAGNVITIEPGVYIPGWGGVRIEDTILVTKTGYKSLTKSTKKINEVTVNQGI